MSSKFSKPKPAGAVSQTDIERVIQGADAVDDRREDKKSVEESEVRFTMTLPGEMSGRVDRARKSAGGLTRLSWIRVAVAEKLSRDGF
ncbi:hypothetical protein N825_27050 [Skermanella stibiiresistens SB22]|uniref:Uncharacterized protein n=1 Tax=Skermanella stibiiresistens SB22 TaxID=1385369 RepID=W9GUQ7_9PROT|nr:hypothetical protein [Skermanella stibiiresistens]EWY36406.1 hypothetical protein N825_27050 [Skermanella stibiiresistens SB22]